MGSRCLGLLNCLESTDTKHGVPRVLTSGLRTVCSVHITRVHRVTCVTPHIMLTAQTSWLGPQTSGDNIPSICAYAPVLQKPFSAPLTGGSQRVMASRARGVNFPDLPGSMSFWGD